MFLPERVILQNLDYEILDGTGEIYRLDMQ